MADKTFVTLTVRGKRKGQPASSHILKFTRAVFCSPSEDDMSKQLFTLKEIQAERMRLVNECNQAKAVLNRTESEYPTRIFRALWERVNRLYDANFEELDARFEVAEHYMAMQSTKKDTPPATPTV